MTACRICLSEKPDKDILELQVNEKRDVKSFAEIIMFCLDIQVEQDSKISTKLCLKCHKKILTFYKFKSLALNSDAYLRSVEIKNEIYLKEDEIKIESEELSIGGDADELKHELNDDICLKRECPENDFNSASEDELLSVIKKIKYEYVEEVKENEPKIRRRKRTKVNSNVASSSKQMCEECGKTVSDLKAHSYLHLPMSERKRIKCHVCDKMFSSHSARYKHNKIKHLGVKQICTICNKAVTHLRQHNRVVHDRESLPLECVECGRRFISKSNLDLHMRTHTKDRPFGCDLCDKKFATKGLVHQHIRSVHDKEKSHLCQLCSKSFFKKYHLHVHLKSHSKEKTYECPDCGKFYKTVATLKSHRETHGDVRNFGCQICTQTFMKKDYLMAHMLSHTKEKRYSCQYCGVKFHRSDHRKRHEYTAHQKHLLASTTSST
ncbi:unnamed protein product [Arctia plantaginis]|uniref:Uncharacterized protein n=1 Tax=Arctia plantaginis TaxID=874455 RepID=A0A8S0YVL2_ARCPL|nr:unnamed protein product [Arctia plantaginis]